MSLVFDIRLIVVFVSRVGVQDTVFFDEMAVDADFAVAHDCELRPADDVLDDGLRLDGVEPVVVNGRIDVFQKCGLGIGLAFDGRDVEYPVVGEPDPAVLEGMAVGFVHGTMRRETKMDDTGFVPSDGLEVLVKILEIESLEMLAGCRYEPAPVRMADTGGFEFIVLGHLSARSFDYDNTHG